MNRPTPALVTPQAARRLPRWVPWLLVAVYVLPGFWGRDPWRGADLTSLAVMLDMHGGGPWLLPQVLGEAVLPLAWLPYWLGATAIECLPLPTLVAARLPFMVALGLTLACTWYGTYRLARLPTAQPLAPALGEAVAPVDYARAVADGALLALVATLGLAMLAHETTPTALQLAGVTLWGWAGTLGWAPAAARGVASASLLAIGATWAGAGILSLSGAPWLVLPLGLAHAVWWWRTGVRRAQIVLALAGAAAALAAAWALLPTGLGWSAFGWPDGFDVLDTAAWRSLGRLLAWFVWPSAALALWALWRWRAHLRSPHIGWPLTQTLIVLLASVADGANDRVLVLALPSIATLAAWALPTLRGSLSAAIDWFALLLYSGAAVIVWVIWIAMMTGVPAKPAANVARLVPGFEPALNPLPLGVALAGTAAWLALVAWRLGRHAPALWKGLVLSAAGFTLNWLLLMTLWLPLLNWGLGLRPISERIARLVPTQACVAVTGLSHGDIGALRLHGGLHLQRLGSHEAQRCPLLVAGPRTRGLDPSQWRLRADLPRLRENRERWQVYERVAPAADSAS
ncbi:hypothetical protein [Tepidimonas aquatica]|uniref:Uncharacterized protein n=1 Tax=Tepidimonas aquatica TaxID=247482 RepID=A0A554WMA4_9BURK|nr:hypothetical protein [Tepidimonas aquatica]TSE24703.1 hypothetical protein Taqua_01411 [Tepidimonas aquatica]